MSSAVARNKRNTVVIVLVFLVPGVMDRLLSTHPPLRDRTARLRGIQDQS